MFPNITAVMDWIEQNIINGFAAKIFEFFKNIALRLADIGPFIEMFMSIFSIFSA